jgi:hypothetical protein
VYSSILLNYFDYIVSSNEVYSSTPLSYFDIQSKSLKGVLEYTLLLLTIYSENHLRVNSNIALVTTDNIKSKSFNGGVFEYTLKLF